MSAELSHLLCPTTGVGARAYRAPLSLLNPTANIL